MPNSRPSLDQAGQDRAAAAQRQAVDPQLRVAGGEVFERAAQLADQRPQRLADHVADLRVAVRQQADLALEPLGLAGAIFSWWRSPR